MAIKQLTEQQIKEWTLQQKDEWWLKNVYKGNMRQLTLRAVLTGVVLGCVLTVTNLYVGIKTGWTLGVGITSVILSFAAFKAFSKFNLAEDMTILENNAMQSIATSAGYMTAPMMASISGYMMVTGIIPPMWQVYCWIVVLGLLGALFAFPQKKRAINDEQLPFPEGYAAGVVLENLHSADEKDGIVKAKLLGLGAGLAALLEILRSEKLLDVLYLKFLSIPHYWDDLVYKFFTPNIAGIPLKDLTIRLDTSIVLMGSGALISFRTACSMITGAIVNYAILAPIMMNQGIIVGGGFKNISIWALWGGAAMMTTASLYSFFSSDSTIAGVKSLFNKTNKPKVKQKDVLADIELPGSVSTVGIIVLSIIAIIMGKAFFDIDYWLTAVAIPLVFVFSIMAIKSTGMTGITPGGALAKMTQVIFSVLAPGNMGTSLIVAGVTSEVSLGASNLLMDIKPAYMLGGKPRQQAMGHAIGVFAGALIAVPAFYFVFNGDISLFGTERFPMPGATVWAAVAKVLSNGFMSLHETARFAVVAGAVLGIVMEILVKKTKGKFPISPVGFGIAFVLPFADVFIMFLGSFIFWLLKLKPEKKRSAGYHTFVENQETVAAGVVAGGGLIGIAILIFENLY
ncbi:MAG: OPT/YSL family transporter [Bdellovibrionaceae bacterium]|nr:OPT/YSL family transporter [Pseudobdellovibrionaceae bacterium]